MVKKKQKKDKSKEKKNLTKPQNEKTNDTPQNVSKDTIGRKIYLYVMKD